jgi:NodT family efflux transporter outer membrane factor (OMF) lipoprotein
MRNRNSDLAVNIVSLALLVAATLTLTGCAVGPQYTKPEITPNDSWRANTSTQLTAQPPADTAWWRSFNDPTLERLVQLAYSQNVTLQATGVRILEARAVVGIAAGRRYPQFQSAFASATGINLSENVANNQDFDRDFWDFQTGFDVAWEADFWGKYGRTVKAEQAAYLSSMADYQNALVSLSAEVARTYTDIRTFEVLIEQARRNVVVQEEGFQIADARFRNGATSELDVAQARTLLENTRASIPQLEINLVKAKNALSTLLGQHPGAVDALLQGPPVIPAAPAQVAVSIPAEMLRRRPDIRSAELVAMSQSERIGVAKADLYPRFVFSGTLGFQRTTGGDTPSVSLFNPASLFFALGPKVHFPFFNYGRLENQVRIEDARFQQLLFSYQNSVLKASQEVEDGVVGFIKSQEAAVAQENAVTSARRAVELAFLQYREGATDFLRVLDAERTQLQEENSLARIRSSVVTHLISLYKALGGGWETGASQRFISEETQQEMQGRTNWGKYFEPVPTANEVAPDTKPAAQPETK